MFKVGDLVRRTRAHNLIAVGEVVRVSHIMPYPHFVDGICITIETLEGRSIGTGTWNPAYFKLAIPKEPEPDYKSLYLELKKQHDEMYQDFLERTT